VELLIVIVVIGILATISIVAYNGITQKAKNTAIINAASQSLKMIEAYVAQYGEYPGTGWFCVTTDMSCVWDSGSIVPVSSVFNSNMAKIGSLPKSVPVSGSNGNGLVGVYSSNYTTQDGVSTPFTLWYWLLGKNQKCGVNGVVSFSGYTLIPSATGYTNGISVEGTKTMCVISIPGPAHS
jgi:type II secretory pathway pseudopilin PulG